MKTCRRFILAIYFVSMTATAASSAQPTPKKLVLDKLATAVASKSIDPSRLNVLADQSVQLKLHAAVPLLRDILEEKLAKPASAEGVVAYHLARVVAAVCELGRRDDYRAMVKVFAAAPPNSNLQKASVNTLLSYGCKYETADALMQRANQEFVFPELDEPLLQKLRHAPAELQSAWKYYRNAAAPFRAISQESAKTSLSADMNWTRFYATIEDSLVGKDKANFGQVAAFQWGNWCGTGSEMLYAPRSRAMVLELLRAGHFSESIGAILEISSSRMLGRSTAAGSSEFLWKRQLIELCGLDWERLYLGKVVNDSSGNELRMLAAYGGEKTVQRLLMLVDQEPKDDSELANQLSIISMLVEPTRAQSTRIVYGGPQLTTRAKGAPKISQQSQRAVLNVLHSHVKATSGPRILKEVVDELVRLERSESIAALHRAAALKYYEVAKSAAECLRQMGEEVTQPKPPLAGRFQLQLGNGSPLAGTEVSYSTSSDGKSTTMSSGGTTDVKGAIEVKGSWFSDPRVDASVMKFSSKRFSSLDQTIFAINAKVPADRSSAIKVPIVTHSLRLLLKNSPVGTDAKVSLEYRGPVEKAKTSSFFMSMGGQIKTRLRDAIDFPRLGDGRYIISLDIPGRALWRSSEIVMQKKTEIVVDLRLGANLRFELVTPGGKYSDKQPQYKLVGLPTRDYYRYFDYPRKGFRGLPVGEYTLKILSSLEKRNSQFLRGNQDKIKEDKPLPGDYHGQEIKVVITGDEPIVDLGHIRLKPIAP